MKFIHFGCWNKGLCSDTGTNGLSLMTKKLNEYIFINPISFLIIAGDNFYPKKELSGKKFDEINFKSGFDCLPKEIKKYLIFGNHDIDDIIIDSDDSPIKCKLLDEQIKLAEENNTIEIFNDVLHKIINNTLIIMLDSNLYIENEDKMINETCYTRLFNRLVNKSELKIKDLLEYQNIFISNLIRENLFINKIIFVAHHPIYSIKSKIKSGEEKKDDFELKKFVDYLKSIQDLLLDKNIFYLCADTHLYQEGIINISPELQIKQYIVGTGGAEQDNIYTSNDTIVENGYIVYTKMNEKKEYGFLEVNVTDDEIEYKFISIDVLIGGSCKLKNNQNQKKYKIIKKIKVP